MDQDRCGGTDEGVQIERRALRYASDEQWLGVGDRKVAWKMAGNAEKICGGLLIGYTLQRRKNYEISDSAPPARGVTKFRRFSLGKLRTELQIIAKTRL